MRGYHRITITKASITLLPNNNKSFDLPPLNRILYTIGPHFWREGKDRETEEAFATRCAQELEDMNHAEGSDMIAVFIAEPLMGAGGVFVPSPAYLAKIEAVPAKFYILLIADEVICGFGRTENIFGSTTYGIKPDILTVSKQISSSYFPFSAFHDHAHGTIAEESGGIGVLGHG